MFQSQSHWFSKAIRLRGSIAVAVLPRSILFGAIAAGVVALYRYKPDLPWDSCQYLVNNVVLNLILGLLLVFRTNTAYERFWEGRKAWGDIITHIRNLLREIDGTAVIQAEQGDPKQQALVWLITLAIATKAHLRQNIQGEEFAALLTKVERQKLTETTHAPMLILRWLQGFTNQHIEVHERMSLQEKYAALTEGITTCERILNTPLPSAYAIFLQQFILSYCLLLPFGLVTQLGWGTIPITALVAFVLLGVEAIAAEIENPFGEDANDLPLDELCTMLTTEAQELGILTKQKIPAESHH